jgi:2-polyprenyl-3-methyl-5-hydroxy-6-metoxy-1,4-benzoquinol methylase
MSERDDESGGGGASLEGGRIRKNTMRSGRRRSLRVPVDEVPRRPPSSGQQRVTEEDLPLAPIAPEPTQVSVTLPDIVERTTPSTASPRGGKPLPSAEMQVESDAEELGDGDLGDEPPIGAPMRDGPSGDLDMEPTRVAPPESDRPGEAATTPGGVKAAAKTTLRDVIDEVAKEEARDAAASSEAPKVAERSVRESRPPMPGVAVVVQRVVKISSPPPAMKEPKPRDPDATIEEQLDLGLRGGDGAGERFQGRAERTSAPDLTDMAEADVEEIEPVLRPPPPPREPAKSDPRIADLPKEVREAREKDKEKAKAKDQDAARADGPRTDPSMEKVSDEEELAPEDLEVEASPAPAKKAKSVPPPRPSQTGMAKAPPPPDKAAAKGDPKAADPSAADKAAAAAAAALDPGKRAKKKANWWEDFFNDDYLRTVPPPNPKVVRRHVDFLVARLGLKPGATILDVGCGLGLHAIELTRRGYLVVGLDLSLPMLSRAADEAQDQGFRINFLHADMREMTFEGGFDAVLCIGTTFGYFDDDQNRQTIERLYKAMKPKGLLLLDVVNRDFVMRNQPNLVWFEGDGCVVMEETHANYITSRLHVKRTVILDDGRQKENNYSVRVYSLHELGRILHDRGFRVVEVSGREATPGVFFGADSPKLIIVAERRPQQAAPPSPPKKSAEGGEGAGAGESSLPPAPDAAPTSPGGTPSEGDGGSSA